MILDIPKYDGIGVYKITHTITGGIYIGSSLNCYRRLNQHSKNPQNIKMTEDSALGPFVAEILKKFPDGCTNRELADAERYYCELYDATSERNYNDIVHSRYFHNSRRGKLDDYVFCLLVPKGRKSVISDRAKSLGMSANAYINMLIDADMSIKGNNSPSNSI
jgi:hypothetical protein